MIPVLVEKLLARSSKLKLGIWQPWDTILVAQQGFEPRLDDPESSVLPLDDRAYKANAYIIAQTRALLSLKKGKNMRVNFLNIGVRLVGVITSCS